MNEKKCVVCKDWFRGRAKTCGSPVCNKAWREYMDWCGGRTCADFPEERGRPSLQRRGIAEDPFLEARQEEYLYMGRRVPPDEWEGFPWLDARERNHEGRPI